VKPRARRQTARVALGRGALDCGQLTFVQDGRREYSAYAYSASWLANADRFEISPDLPLTSGHVNRRAPTAEDSPFPFAIADTEPDAWGTRVILRAHARQRQVDADLEPLTRFDILASVDDFARLGAIRLRGEDGAFLRSGDRYRTPPLIDLEKVYAASRAVEEGNETRADLDYLQGKGTSLGGMRPKCSVLEADGTLAIGKFPSVGDSRSIPRGEVLALLLASRAGLDAAQARIESLDGLPVALIRRFDRDRDGARLPYLSGGSLLQVSRADDHSYTELADALRRIGARPVEDAVELWSRLVFNLLITNTEDHLWNLGVLYAGRGQWRLAPAFDLNPFPDKRPESKTWLAEDSGPIVALEQLLGAAPYFGLGQENAEAIVARIAQATMGWREVACSPEIGLRERELETFTPAFEHEPARAARALIR
jgi:serine/threonine-protein kinase HipA